MSAVPPPRRLPVEGRFWTAANVVTLTRVPLALVSIAFLVAEARPAALVFMVAALATDAIDGTVARWTGEVSDWGKILDPLGDKLVLMLLGLTLVLIDRMPVWFWAVLVARDLIIGGGGIGLVLVRGVVPEADRLGKLSTLLLSVYLIRQAFWPTAQAGVAGLDRVGLDLLGGLAVALLLASTVGYLVRGWRLWTRGPAPR